MKTAAVAAITHPLLPHDLALGIAALIDEVASLRERVAELELRRQRGK